jgi:predicted exporter
LTPGVRLTALALAGAAFAVFCAVRFEASTDISDFLAAPGSASEGALSRRLTRSEVTRSIVLSVSAPDLAVALRAAEELAARLAADPAVAYASAGPDPELPSILERLYFEHRYQLWSDAPEQELPERFAAAGLAEAAGDLKRALAGPLAPLVRNLAPQDPWMTFIGMLRRLQGAGNPPVALRDGRFVSPDGRSAIVFAGTAWPALDAARHAPLFERLDVWIEELDRAADGSLEVELSALSRFAVRAAGSMRTDIARISIASSVGILTLFLAAFRSARLIAIASLPLAAGLLVGLATCLALFGRVNGLTLAFGGALVGVCIDYPIHLLAHWLQKDDDPDGTAALASVWPGIRLGAATSFAAFAALAGTGFPGIREIGIFAGAGIVGAVVVTTAGLPFLLRPRRPDRNGASEQVRWANALTDAIRWLGEHRPVAAMIPLAALAVALLGLPNLRWNDNVSALSPVDPELVAEETRVRDRVLGTEASRVVIALGRTEEEALERNDATALALERLVASGSLDEFRSLHSFVWSAALQRRNEAVLDGHPDLATRFVDALESEGFHRDAFDPFVASLSSRPEPLRIDALADSAIGPWIRPFLLPPDERGGDPEATVALASLVRGVHDPAALAAALAPLEGVVYLDQFASLEAGYGALRRAALRTVGLGVVLVLALLWLHYRALGARPVRATAIALLPSLLAGSATIGLLALSGQPLNLVHLFGLLLVLGMGVDYGIFLAESARQHERVGATVLGLLLSCITSVLGLGLLALSNNPGLRALGVTTAIGVISSLLLSAAVLALLDGRGRGPRDSLVGASTP